MEKFLSTYHEKYHLKDKILSLTVLVQCYAIEHLWLDTDTIDEIKIFKVLNRDKL